MKSVVLWDKSVLIVEDDQARKIAQAMSGSKPFAINHKSGQSYLQPKAIAMIRDVRYGEYSTTKKFNLLEAPTERAATPESVVKLREQYAEVRKRIKEKRKNEKKL